MTISVLEALPDALPMARRRRQARIENQLGRRKQIGSMALPQRAMLVWPLSPACRHNGSCCTRTSPFARAAALWTSSLHWSSDLASWSARTSSWPASGRNTFVEQANLKVHIAALRRALGDGSVAIGISDQYSRTGLPICCAGHVRGGPAAVSAGAAAATKREHNLPTRLTRLIGRADIINELAERLPRRRLLTIAGPGGIGKTAVALAVAERLIEAYEHGVWLIDLASLSDPLLVPSAVVAALGITIRSEQPLPGLIASLRDKRMLLVLDNCEHVIASAAEHWPPKSCKARPACRSSRPAASRCVPRVSTCTAWRRWQARRHRRDVNAREALGFPAVELFVSARAASLGEFELDDADAPVVAEICRKLDGIPLAIEFAAARADAIGVRGVAACMEDCLTLLTGRPS